MAGLGRRVYEVLRANLNALLDRAGRRQRERAEHEPDLAGEGRAAPSADRVIAQHYANLELPYGADLETVKKQYRRLMGRYHPDRHHQTPEKQEVANRLAAELTRSYDALVAHLTKS